MNRIFKYGLDIVDEQTIEMPIWSALLSAVEQNGSVVVYALIDDVIKETVNKKFRIVGTGHSFPDHNQWLYFTTVSMLNGLVWHIFIEKLDQSH